ncbi:histidine phosphatase family protein [Mycobacterium sp. NPDC048908]|uniref:histidine phosphatase family protein n=1 Tax=Mycobacterium sp. NPDC048908 TaxID=3364292 RepID=UPI0037100F97
MRRLSSVAATVLTTIALMLATALPAWAAEAMTLTFVRHGESAANAAGVIDTSVPGPHLTSVGQQQAEDIADALKGNAYDGVYASSMIRTQETAQPLADKLGLPITVLPGVREIDAGVFEGQSEDSGLGRIGYVLGPVAWTLGARFVPVLGAADGNAFDARVDDAVQTIYDSGDRNAVVFSHGATIMFWTMMNVDNPDLGLLLRHPLDNTDVVVITGNPEDGWTLENWAGVDVAAEPSLPTKLFVDTRNVVTAPQTALYRIGRAFAAGDVAGLAKAVRDGVVDVATKVVGFVPKVVGDVVDSLRGATPNQSAPQEAATLSATTGERTTAETPKTAKPAKKTEKKPAENTKLKSGNKFRPGQTAATTPSTPQPSTPKDDPETVTSNDQQATDTTESTGATNKSAAESDHEAAQQQAA